jgi:hypothetical protein
VEPFRVTCETCRSRLKVRSAEAIGEIHACPKCGSMVRIVPPADWSGGDSVTCTAVAAEEGALRDPALSISTTASTIAPADFNFDIATEPAVATPAVAELPVPDAEVATGGISKIVWCAIGGAVTFIVAGATYILWPAPPQVVAKPGPAVAAADAKPEIKTASTPSSEQPAEAKTDPYAVKRSTDDPAAPLAKPISADPPKPAEEQIPSNDAAKAAVATLAPSEPVVAAPADAASPPHPLKVAVATPPAPSERPDAAPKTANATSTSRVLKFDPLDFDPEHLSLSSTPTAAPNELPPAASTSSIPATPPADAPIADAPPEKAPDAADVLPAPSASQAVNVRRGPVGGDDSKQLDTARHLAMRVKSLQLTDTPMARFIDSISEISGAPITLDPIALELNGQSARTPISIDVANVSLDKVLKDALTGQRLAVVVQGNHLTVGLADGDERRAVDFDVKDIVSDGNVGPIAKLLEQFVAPQTWKANGGKGTIEINGRTLHIDQSLIVRREALVFCERLRLARGQSLRSKYPANLLTIDSPHQKLSPKLNQTSTFTFLAWSRLADVARQWQEMSGISILVDWSALRDVELMPSSPIACSTIARPWAEALDGVLEPLNLGWWAVDSQTIQITSLDALERIERVEFYAVPKKLRGQSASTAELIETLQKEIADRPNKHGKPSDVRMQFDEPSGRLIVRATPDIQRFLTAKLGADANR